MKIAGQKVHLPPRDIIIFPRAEGQFVFHVQGVASFEEFDTICSRPAAPKIMRRGVTSSNTDDPTYKKQLETWANMRQNWLILRALDCVENNITWESVDLAKPETWSELERELREAGLSEIEYNRLVGKVYEVNALSERAMEAARSDFLLMTLLAKDPSDSQPGEPNSI